MKKSLLALGAACIALSGMAAAPQKVQSTSVKNIDRSVELKSTSNLRVDRNASLLKKAPAKAMEVTDVIYDVEGTRQDMTATATGYYVFLIFPMQYADATSATHVVYGENDEVYFSDIIPNAGTDAYVKGVKNGDKIEISLPQTVLYAEEYGYGLNLCLMSRYTEVDEETGEEYFGYELADAESVTLTLAEDGSITAEGISDELILGYAYTDDDSWSGYGVSALSMVEFNEVAVTVPEDMEVVEAFWMSNAGGYGLPVNWAQGYDEVYFQGLCSELPEAWVKGTVEYEEDGVAIISIAQDQYIGVYGGAYIYTKAGVRLEFDENGQLIAGELAPEDAVYQIVWDYENMTLTPKDPEVGLIFNGAQDRIYYLQIINDLYLIHQDSFEGTPVMPENLSFETFMDSFGYDAFFFNIPAISTEGKFLNTDDLYYVVYVDDEEWVFDAEEYDFPETLVEIPWDFSAYYIYSNGGSRREVDFFVEGITTLGVQSVYKYNGEETRSEIATLDLSGSAVNGINADKKIASVKMYDVAGREVAKDAKGIVIKRVVYEDGTVATFKNMAR